MFRVWWACVAIGMLVISGCAGEKVKKKIKAKASTKAAATAESGSSIPSVDVGPGVDKHTGLDIDEKRVRAFSPMEWRRAPKSPNYLVRYQSKAQLAYPTVIVIADDPPEGFSEVTKANHEKFAEVLAAKVAAPGAGDGKATKSKKPIVAMVGAHYGVTWSASGEAKLDNIPKEIERDCTAVVVGGRMYTVEAWAPVGKLDKKAKAAGHAVAAALAVPSSEPVDSSFPTPPVAAPAPAPAPEPAKPPKAAEKPAPEKKPAAGKP